MVPSVCLLFRATYKNGYLEPIELIEDTFILPYMGNFLISHTTEVSTIL